MFPTQEQYQALADWESPTKTNCANDLALKCSFPFESIDDCLACTRDRVESECSPKQRHLYCETNGTGLPKGTQPATLCGENKDASYSTCGKLVYRASQFEADAQIGRLLDNLDNQGLSNSTMVIFSGDVRVAAAASASALLHTSKASRLSIGMLWLYPRARMAIDRCDRMGQRTLIST